MILAIKKYEIINNIFPVQLIYSLGLLQVAQTFALVEFTSFINELLRKTNG